MNIDNNIPMILLWYKAGNFYLKPLRLPQGYTVDNMSQNLYLVIETLSTQTKNKRKWYNKSGTEIKKDKRGRMYCLVPRRNNGWICKGCRFPNQIASTCKSSFSLNTVYSIAASSVRPTPGHISKFRQYDDGYMYVRAAYRKKPEGYTVAACQLIKVLCKNIY